MFIIIATSHFALLTFFCGVVLFFHRVSGSSLAIDGFEVEGSCVFASPFFQTHSVPDSETPLEFQRLHHRPRFCVK